LILLKQSDVLGERGLAWVVHISEPMLEVENRTFVLIYQEKEKLHIHIDL
jgi:hypothetical protein